DHAGPEVALELGNVKCARQRVRDMIADEYVRILLVNPSMNSFTGDLGVTVDGTTHIPNDNLMYRSAKVDAVSNQSVQDANLIKVHVGFCFELIVPLVDRLIAGMIAHAPTSLEPENFGPPAADSFSHACTVDPKDPERLGIPLFAQSVMRMQT